MDQIQLAVLQFLKLRWDTAPIGREPFVLPLTALARQHSHWSRGQLRVHLKPLETSGYVKRVEYGPGDPNPGYYITALGDSMVDSPQWWTAPDERGIPQRDRRNPVGANQTDALRAIGRVLEAQSAEQVQLLRDAQSLTVWWQPDGRGWVMGETDMPGPRSRGSTAQPLRTPRRHRRVCATCGRDYESARATSRYCSAACVARARYRRLRGLPIADSPLKPPDRCRVYTDDELQVLCEESQRLRGVPGGASGARLAELLRTLGQNLDRSGATFLGIFQERDGFRVTAAVRGRIVFRRYPTRQLLTLSRRYRATRGIS